MGFTYYSDFKLGDKKLSDFGGKLHNGDGNLTKNLLPILNKKTKDTSLLDGVIYHGGKYEPKEIPLNILIENENFNEEEFKNWIKSKEQRWFNYIGDEWKIKVIYDDSLDMEIFNRKQALISLKLIAYSPHWYLITDTVFSKASPVVGTVYSFVNKGSEVSFPLIKITCGTTQNVTFELNGKKYLIKTMIGDMYIDFYTETVYKVIGGEKLNYLSSFENINGVYKYEFGELKVGNNNIKIISGIVDNLVVNCNSRNI